MASARILTFITDFGTRDTFVGQMKGAALAIHPDLTLVDITHDVPPQDVATGAFLLETSCALFPPGTIHVAVVDPGVGTARRAIAVDTGRYVFVAPDNGILTRALAREGVERAHAIEARHYRRTVVSATFEGRDVFAPAAAWIARGIDLANLGPPVDELVRLEQPRVELEPGKPCRVRVVLVDRFGNATLDLTEAELRRAIGSTTTSLSARVDTPRGSVAEFRRTFAEGEGERPFLLVNSSGYLEIAIRGGDAATRLALAPGAEVVVTAGPSGAPDPRVV